MELPLSNNGKLLLEEPGSGYKQMFVLSQHLEGLKKFLKYIKIVQDAKRKC